MASPFIAPYNGMTASEFSAMVRREFSRRLKEARVAAGFRSAAAFARTLVHVPTGASFILGSSFINYGRAGDVLPDGRDFDRGDVRQVAHHLMVEKARETQP